MLGRHSFITALLAAAGLAMVPAAHAVSTAQLEAESARVYAQMKATVPMTTDQEIIDYVACVAKAVVKVLEPPFSEYQWELAVFEVEQINAGAFPGGKIYVNEGILKAARNQHQLAAVIGHEIAHVTAQHGKRRASRVAMSDLGVRVAAVVIGQGHSGATYSAYAALREGAAYGLFLPFSRKAETEADVIGLKYMARAGFDPRQAVPLWQNMSAESGEDPPEFSSTHPSDEKRIESLISQWIEVLPLYNEALQAGNIPACAVPDSLERELAELDAKKNAEQKKE